MADPRLNTASLAWGLSLGISFGKWLRGTLKALMPVPRVRDPDWRRSFNHENTNRPQGEPPLKFRRSTDGYQPRPQQGTPNPPPSEP